MSNISSLEFDVLSERIKAQIEIYEKFSQAFERTMEILRSNGVKIDDVHEEVVSEIREVIKSLVQLSHEVRLQGETNRERWSSVQNDLQHNSVEVLSQIRDLSQDKLIWHSVYTALNELRSEVKLDVSEKQTDMLLSAKDLAEQLQVMHSSLCQLIKDEKDRADSLALVPKQVQSVYEIHTERKTAIKNRIMLVITWLLAVSFVIGLAERFIQLGYLHMSWGGAAH